MQLLALVYNDINTHKQKILKHVQHDEGHNIERTRTELGLYIDYACKLNECVN